MKFYAGIKQAGAWTACVPHKHSELRPDADDEVMLMCQRMKSFPVCEEEQSSPLASL